MTRIVRSVPEPFVTPDGSLYTARVCGRQRIDGLWEGWVEFTPADAAAVLRTPRETTQPNLIDLEYWASGLRPVYLEGALNRAMAAAQTSDDDPSQGPPDGGPAPGPTVRSGDSDPVDTASPDVTDVRRAVLDPFSAYRKGEDGLRRQLGALQARHLRGIVRAYGLAGVRDVDLQALDDNELVELIIAGVRGRLAA